MAWFMVFHVDRVSDSICPDLALILTGDITLHR